MIVIFAPGESVTSKSYSVIIFNRSYYIVKILPIILNRKPPPCIYFLSHSLKIISTIKKNQHSIKSDFLFLFFVRFAENVVTLASKTLVLFFNSETFTWIFTHFSCSFASLDSIFSSNSLPLTLGLVCQTMSFASKSKTFEPTFSCRRTIAPLNHLVFLKNLNLLRFIRIFHFVYILENVLLWLTNFIQICDSFISNTNFTFTFPFRFFNVEICTTFIFPCFSTKLPKFIRNAVKSCKISIYVSRSSEAGLKKNYHGTVFSNCTI